MTAPLHERLAQLAELVQVSAPGPWHSDGVEVYEAGCDDHPLASCECNTTCRPDNEQAEMAQYIAACQPSNVAKLCEQVRVMKEALEGAYALAIGHAAHYQHQHGLEDLHPTHESILDKSRAALDMVKAQ